MGQAQREQTLCPKFQCPCCPAVVMALWKRQLPANVRSGIAGMSFDHTTFKDVLQHADDIHASNAPPSSQVAAVRLTAASASPSVSLDETQPAIPYAAVPEVAAAARGGWRGGRGGRGGRGNRGGGNNGGQQQKQQNQNQSGGQSRFSGPKHPDLPPGEWRGCRMHHRWGKGAHFCSEPSTCPWKNVFTPKPQK